MRLVDKSFQKLYSLSLLAILLALSVGLKLRYFSQSSLWPDEALYLFIARNLSSDPFNLADITGQIFFHNPPLIMYVLSLAGKISFVEFDQAARFVIILMGGATVYTIFLIGRRLYSPVVGLLAAAVLATCPLNNWTGVRILTDVPVVFFIYLAICMWIYEKRAFFYIFGICAVLTKYSAFPLLLLPLISRLKPRTWSCFYLGLFLFLSAFTITKHLYPAPGGWVAYFYNFFQSPNILHMVAESRFFIGFFFIGLGLIGFAMTIKEQKYSILFHWFCIFGIFRIFLPWVMFRVSRYTLPAYPALFVFAAYGCYESARLVAYRWPVYRNWILVFFIISFSSVLFNNTLKSNDILQNSANTFIGFKEAAEFLKNQDEVGGIATASPRQMKYFAPELAIYDIPRDSSSEQFLSSIKIHKIRYLVIDLWSPHLPEWCKNFDYQKNGCQLVHNQDGVYVLMLARE